MAVVAPIYLNSITSDRRYATAVPAGHCGVGASKIIENSLLDSLDRNGEHVSHTAFGPNYPRGAGVTLELAPEAENLHIDASVEDVLVNTSSLQKMFAAEGALRRFEKGKQHGILALG